MAVRSSEKTGAAIRKLRKARGWSLVDLAEATGLPVSTLSRLELGQTALKQEKLLRLCRAFGVDVDSVLPPEVRAGGGRRAVTRAGEGATTRLGGHAGRLAAADLLQKTLMPVVLELAVGHAGEPVRVAGEVYLVVLEGAVVLTSPVYAPLELATGDSVYFDAEAGFSLAAATPSRLLIVATAAAFP